MYRLLAATQLRMLETFAQISMIQNGSLRQKENLVYITLMRIKPILIHLMIFQDMLLLMTD